MIRIYTVFKCLNIKVKGPFAADLLNLEASRLGRPLPHQLTVIAPAGANHLTPEARELSLAAGGAAGQKAR